MKKFFIKSLLVMAIASSVTAFADRKEPPAMGEVTEENFASLCCGTDATMGDKQAQCAQFADVIAQKAATARPAADTTGRDTSGH